MAPSDGHHQRITFPYAEAYAEQHGLQERSGRLPQHFSVLKRLLPAKLAKEVEWRDTGALPSDSSFDHARIFVKSTTATTTAWRVGFSPYPAAIAVTAFQEIATQFGLKLIIGDEQHGTYEVKAERLRPVLRVSWWPTLP